MRDAGYGDESLRRVRQAYDVTTRLFTAKFRGSGKPLLSHLGEDHLDLGILYCRNAADRRAEIERSLHLCVALASRIGQPFLAAELTRVFEETTASSVPDALRHAWDYTYLLMPASGMSRSGAWIRRLLDAHPRVARLLHPGRLWMPRRSTEVLAAAEPR